MDMKHKANEIALAICLSLGLAAVTVGVGCLSVSGAWITGGICLVLWAILMFSEV
jgi:hypothetical protein